MKYEAGNGIINIGITPKWQYELGYFSDNFYDGSETISNPATTEKSSILPIKPFSLANTGSLTSPCTNNLLISSLDILVVCVGITIGSRLSLSD